ncbi:MAG: hypothetical protein U0931_07575 [Vulcanimicrobiota bacterium]
MPELQRYLSRAGEVLARERGATDQLCAGHQQLSSHPHLQDLFMAAMRENLSWHILRDHQLARACLDLRVRLNQLRLYSHLEGLPVYAGQIHTPAGQKRDLRRWCQVWKHSLCDLGWSRPRRRNFSLLADLFRCSAGHWHLPRVVHERAGRLFTPCYRSCSSFAWSSATAINQGICPCGRSGQWSPEKIVLPLWHSCEQTDCDNHEACNPGCS